jgi:ribokinase
MEEPMTVVVFGSINMDLVVRAVRLPLPGETLIGQAFFTAPGGKGANQAVAAARLGATTRLVGRVGEDVFGSALRASLESYGVETAAVVANPGPSGVAIITVDDSAENTIIVAPGANNLIGAEDIVRLETALAGAQVLLLQLEVPYDAVLAAAQAAKRQGIFVILDPAPAPTSELPAELYALVDLITPNEHEATLLTGLPIGDFAQAEKAAQELVARGVQQAIIKMSSRGALWFDGRIAHILAPFRVTAIDTVGAGDAFNGGVAAALSEGRPVAEALRWGMACGALSVTKSGAQQSMPARAEVVALLDS